MSFVLCCGKVHKSIAMVAFGWRDQVSAPCPPYPRLTPFIPNVPKEILGLSSDVWEGHHHPSSLATTLVQMRGLWLLGTATFLWLHLFVQFSL